MSVEIHGYTAHDTARFVFETHASVRSDFARDRARLIHSSAWRRLAAKTQVLSPTAGIDFARNRLTHSLEVAQIGRELARAFGVNADLVDTACLAHDIGHPPFGHNGEVALNSWLDTAGGFEGNAQTLRILTRLEPKRFQANGACAGLNLTRAALDASCKYPWPRQSDTDAQPRKKFGFYPDDSEVFHWLRQGAVAGKKCFEAQLMDLSDDIAYSVHDFEDAIVSEYLDPLLLTLRSGHDALLRAVSDWAGDAFTVDELAAAFDRLAAMPSWPQNWTGSRQDAAQLKDFTSDLIGRFAGSAIRATRDAYTANCFVRYAADVVVLPEIRAEIAVLKGIVAAFVMMAGKRKPTYQRQRELLVDLLEALWAQPENLDKQFADDFALAADDNAKRRVIVDQVACLTDARAITMHTDLCQVPLV